MTRPPTARRPSRLADIARRARRVAVLTLGVGVLALALGVGVTAVVPTSSGAAALGALVVVGSALVGGLQLAIWSGLVIVVCSLVLGIARLAGASTSQSHVAHHQLEVGRSLPDAAGVGAGSARDEHAELLGNFRDLPLR